MRDSLTQGPTGYLLLEDGRRFDGWLHGDAAAVGEVVFTTNMAGYQEVLTDPSFAGQIVVMTAPMVGNYGVADADAQSSRPWVAGFVVRSLCRADGGWRAQGPLREYLTRHGIPCLVGVDTRAVTRHVRELGAMRAGLVPSTWSVARARELLLAEPAMRGRDLASSVSASNRWSLAAVGRSRGRVVCLDYGVKHRSLDLLARAGCDVTVVPAGTPVEEILAEDPAGVFVSNGPGDPEAVPGAPEKIREIAAAGIPLFGICLGCQLIARAFGGTTYKLPYGHRGGNHPVRDEEAGCVEITAQNHGFAVQADGDAVAGAPELVVTHRSLNDGTIEGLRHRSLPVFGVQYHPEAAPGPHDSRHLFSRFVAAIDATAAMATG